MTPQAVLHSADNGSQFGRTVRTAGDVNGDGYSDIIVGARRFDRDNRKHKEGAAFVYHGSPSGIVEQPAWAMVGRETQGFFGHAISSAGDINNDGYSDVLVGQLLAILTDTSISSASQTSNRAGRVNVYLGSATGLSTTAAWSKDGDQPQADFGIWVEPAGDVDGDKRDDILIGAWRYDNDQDNEGRVYLYYGSTLMAQGIKGPHRAVTGDYDGDGKTDLLWGYKDSGHLALSMTNNASIAHTELLHMDNDPWRIVGTGDYNGDGMADIIQQNKIDGQTRISFMDANVVVSSAAIEGASDPALRVIGSGDFNKDQRDDVLWYYTASGKFYITLMNGPLVLSGGRLSGVSDPDAVLNIAGVGDFNNDGFDDIIWNHTQSGDFHVTLLQGFEIIYHRLLYNDTHVPLKITGIADFSGDGKDDVLLWNESTGAVYLMTMDGILTTYVTKFAHVSDGWEPAGLGNFDDDQMPDIIWRNRTSGEMIIWIMDGLLVQTSTAIGSGPGPSWEISKRPA